LQNLQVPVPTNLPTYHTTYSILFFAEIDAVPKASNGEATPASICPAAESDTEEAAPAGSFTAAEASTEEAAYDGQVREANSDSAQLLISRYYQLLSGETFKASSHHTVPTVPTVAHTEKSKFSVTGTGNFIKHPLDR